MDNPEIKSEQKETFAAPKNAFPVAKPPLFRLKADKTVGLIIILVVGGFFLAAALFAFFSGSKKTAAGAAKPQAAPVAATVVPAAPAAPVAEPPKAQAAAEEKVSALPLPSLTLTGILYSDAESMALINDKIVPEGGMVDGAKVEKISSDEVELSFEGQKIVLRSR